MKNTSSTKRLFPSGEVWRGFFFPCLLCVLCAFCVACGDDDEKTNPLLTTGNDARPTWTVREGLYDEMELTMSAQVTLQDELLPHAGDDDLMCATIDGEVRAVTGLERTGGEIYFPLVIAGNSGSSSKVTLKYYCSQFKRIYTIVDWMPFTPNIKPTNNDGKPYVVEFIPTEK